MNYKKLISNGKSVRAFKNKKVEVQYFNEIESYIKKSKTLINDIEIDIKMFSDEDIYEKLKNIAGYHGYMIQAPNYVVVLSDVKKGYIENSGYMGERIILKARDLGIDSCWVTINDSKAIKEKLEITSDKEVTAIIALGYEDTKQTKNATIAERISVNQIVYMNKWGNNATLAELEERNLLEAFNYARMAPSTVNRQPWRFIIDAEKLILAIRNDDFTTDYEKGIETGIAMLYFGSIIDTTMFDLKWSVGSIDKDYNIDKDYDVVGYCSI